MQHHYDLNGIVDLANFPWLDVCFGMARSTKNASIFYGHEGAESTALNLDRNKEFTTLTSEQRAWHRTFWGGNPLKGLDILVTSPRDWKGAWYKIDEPDYWIPNNNTKHFTSLLAWINNSGIFRGTGRIIFFIQLQGQHTPPHIDEDVGKIPPGYSKHKEFIWLTPPHNPKRLLVNGVPTAPVVWFDNYQQHETIPENNVRWSLRIDGKFSNAFKEKLPI